MSTSDQPKNPEETQMNAIKQLHAEVDALYESVRKEKLPKNTGITPEEERQHMLDAFSRMDVIMFVGIVLLMALVFFSAMASTVDAAEIDMGVIAQIESSGNPMAHNKADDSIGLYQITPICLKEWNNFHPTNQYSREDLWNPAVNYKIANWYLHQRIPQMLRYYKMEVTTENVIWAYNAGIGNVVKGRKPEITRKYLVKYRGAK